MTANEKIGIRFLLVLSVVMILILSSLLALTKHELSRLTNTLTACRKTPSKLARELTKKEMAAEIARTKKDRANRAWGEYLRGRTKCPSWGECVNDTRKLTVKPMGS